MPEQQLNEQLLERRGRKARRAQRTAPDFSMLPSLCRNLPLCEPMDEEMVQKIDDASMAILEEVGVVFRDPIALADWKKVGVKVEDEKVFLDRETIKELISFIPASFDYHARNPKRV